MNIKTVHNPSLEYNNKNELVSAMAIVELTHMHIPIVVNVAYVPEMKASLAAITRMKQNPNFHNLPVKAIYDALCLAVGWLAKETGHTIWMDNGYQNSDDGEGLCLPFVILSKNAH